MFNAEAEQDRELARREAAVVEAARNLANYEDDHSFAIAAAVGVATQVDALLDALHAAVRSLEELTGPLPEEGTAQ